MANLAAQYNYNTRIFYYISIPLKSRTSQINQLTRPHWMGINLTNNAKNENLKTTHIP